MQLWALGSWHQLAPAYHWWHFTLLGAWCPSLKGGWSLLLRFGSSLVSEAPLVLETCSLFNEVSSSTSKSHPLSQPQSKGPGIGHLNKYGGTHFQWLA